MAGTPFLSAVPPLPLRRPCGFGQSEFVLAAVQEQSVDGVFGQDVERIRAGGVRMMNSLSS